MVKTEVNILGFAWGAHYFGQTRASHSLLVILLDAEILPADGDEMDAVFHLHFHLEYLILHIPIAPDLLLPLFCCLLLIPIEFG